MDRVFHDTIYNILYYLGGINYGTEKMRVH